MSFKWRYWHSINDTALMREVTLSGDGKIQEVESVFAFVFDFFLFIQQLEF